MVDWLAATGTDDFIPFMVIAAVLLAAGIIGLAVANKKARWSALAIVPILLGLTIVGTGAQPAQAADLTACSSSPSPPSSPVTTATPTSTARPTPTETPVCTPMIAFSDVEASGSYWSTNSGTNAFDVEWFADDVQALLDATADPHPTASVNIDVFVYAGADQPTALTVSFDTDQYTNVFTPPDGPGELTLPLDSVMAAISAQLPEADRWVASYAEVVFALPYDDGCASETATLAIGASFPPS